MIRIINARNALLLGAMLVVCALAGCFGSIYTVGDPDKASVNRDYCGDWDGANPKGDHAEIIIRNLDDKHYYVETRDAENHISRYLGFTADVKGATFAHLKPLSEDGNNPAEWLLMRIELKDGKLTIRQLSEEFFKQQPPGSSEQLRQMVAQNLEADAMYAKDETVVATRKGK